jgi:glycosyltransferase involved in cell wall biosynthesis
VLRSTVIVAAHKRKAFIKDAIKSIKENSLEPTEIIVVKNFKDSEIDSFLGTYHIKSIYTDDETLGGKISLGISESSGDILFFLDDDDLFSKNKIKDVVNKFGEYDIGFYHNDQEIFSDKPISSHSSIDNRGFVYYSDIDSQKLKKLLFKFKAGFNTSSIVISRDLAMRCIDLLRNVKITVDTFLLFCAIENKLPIMIDFRRLTLYRRLTSQNSNKDVKLSAIRMYYEDALYFKRIFTSKVLKDFIEMSVIQRELIYKMLSKEISRREALIYVIKNLKYSLKYPTKWNFFLQGLSLMAVFSAEKSKSFYLKKVRSNSMFS